MKLQAILWEGSASAFRSDSDPFPKIESDRISAFYLQMFNRTPHQYVQALTSHFPPLTSHLSLPISHLSSLISQLPSLSSHLSTPISQLSSLTSHLSPLISHLSTLTSHLPPLTSHLSSLISHLPSLTSQLSTPISQLSTLTSHLSSLSLSISPAPPRLCVPSFHGFTTPTNANALLSAIARSVASAASSPFRSVAIYPVS